MGAVRGGAVGRYMLFMTEDPAVKAVAANPAFVTLPDKTVGYPIGLKNNPTSNTAISCWLEKNMTIVLGTDDTDPGSKPQSNSSQERKQGPNFLSRGKRLFREAKKREINFGWSLIIVPGVEHDNKLIAPHARKFLFN